MLYIQRNPPASAIGADRIDHPVPVAPASASPRI